MVLGSPVCLWLACVLTLFGGQNCGADGLTASGILTAQGSVLDASTRRERIMRADPELHAFRLEREAPHGAIADQQQLEDRRDAEDANIYGNALDEDDDSQAPVAVAPGAALNKTNVTVNGTTTIYVDKDMSGVATSIGLMLLGMVTFTMSLFYATHFPDPDVQHATWLTLSEAVSLFSAVLLFTSFKDIMVLQFGETGGHHHGMPDLKSMIISFVRLLFAFWGVQFLLMKYRRTDVPLKAWGSIGGNVVAFAAIDSFGMIQQFAPFRDNPANSFLGMCIAAFMIACMCLSSHIVRDWIMTYDDGVIKEHEKNWNEQCKHVENQFASICIGLLLSIVVRYSISGNLPAVWGSPRNKTQEQINTLFGVSLGFAIPVFAMSMTVASLENHRGALPGIVRSARVTQLILSMSMGWSLVFCGQWEFWSATHGNGVGLGDKMTARMVDALICSYIGFIFIIALDFIADRMKMARDGFNAVSNAFVLALGIAWQGAFSEAVAALSHRFDDLKVRAYMDALMTLILCAVVLPAWVMYMLPKALAGPQPLEDKTKKEADKKKASEGAGGDAGEEVAGDDAQAAEAETGSGAEAQGEEAGRELCATCGSHFEEGAQFCQNCGARSQGGQQESSSTPPGAASTAPQTKGGGKAAASGGKGGRGSVGKVSTPNQPVQAAPTSGDDGGGGSWEQNDSWGGGGGHDESWGGGGHDDWGNSGGGGGGGGGENVAF